MSLTDIFEARVGLGVLPTLLSLKMAEFTMDNTHIQENSFSCSNLNDSLQTSK